jgi:hypothetical protein
VILFEEVSVGLLLLLKMLLKKEGCSGGDQEVLFSYDILNIIND